MVDRHGRLWWSRAAVSHDQAIPQRRLGWLDVECNRCKTEANLPGRYPPAARHGDREAGNLAEISIMPERAPRPQQVEPVLVLALQHTLTLAGELQAKVGRLAHAPHQRTG